MSTFASSSQVLPVLTTRERVADEARTVDQTRKNDDLEMEDNEISDLIGALSINYWN